MRSGCELPMLGCPMLGCPTPFGLELPQPKLKQPIANSPKTAAVRHVSSHLGISLPLVKLPHGRCTTAASVTRDRRRVGTPCHDRHLTRRRASQAPAPAA